MIIKTSPFILSLLIFACAGVVSVKAQARTDAQTPAPAEQRSAAQASSPSSDDDAQDLSITANVTARELRFEVVPEPKVEFTGKPQRKTSWEAERQNLPRPVEPGVTYRNIGIRLKITSIFADIDRIVAEALGEVPLSDDTPQPPTEPPTQPQTEPQAQPKPNTAPPAPTPAQPPSERNPS